MRFNVVFQGSRTTARVNSDLWNVFVNTVAKGKEDRAKDLFLMKWPHESDNYNNPGEAANGIISTWIETDFSTAVAMWSRLENEQRSRRR